MSSARPWDMAFRIFHGTVFVSGRCMNTDLFDGVRCCIVIYTHSYVMDAKLYPFEIYLQLIRTFESSKL